MDALELLSTLISIPSFSGEEDAAANFIELELKKKGIPTARIKNNLWAKNKFFDSTKYTILLNSHLDTVRPTENWTVNPFEATQIDNQLIGLGVNDAGASLVALMYTFCHFYEEKLPFNLIFCASAEEENSGLNGMELVREKLGKIDFAIVGEPTNLEMAIAEKGLLVIDAEVQGEAGHAARNSGKNAITLALSDLNYLSQKQFEKISRLLGNITLNVTQIQSGTQHNVIPDTCRYTIDIRLNECYTHEEILAEIQSNCIAKLTPRSTRLKPSGLLDNHPIINCANQLNIKIFGSPTMSDQALMPWDSVKIGPGKSERSHTADEYILVVELNAGIELYTQLINTLKHETLG